MINAGIQIGSGSVVDTYNTYGLIYLSSDNILQAPSKGFEKTSYPEEAGDHVLPKTVDASFEYKVQFLVEAPNTDLASANAKIKAFNNALYTQATGSDVKVFSQISLYNYYKRVKIVGIPSPISEATEFFRDKRGIQYDAVKVELVINVDNPKLCNFDYHDTTDNGD